MKFKWTTLSFRFRGLGYHKSHHCVMQQTGRPDVDVGGFRRDDRGLWEFRVSNAENPETYVVPGTWQEMRKLVVDEWTKNFMAQ